MTNTSPWQWMSDQLKNGHALYLILDSEGELDVRQFLLEGRGPDQYRSVYSETQISDLADVGPFIFLIDTPDDERIKELLNAPERNWGWLASIRQDDLSALTQHWRERMIIGTRPNQAIYRFHDNRVLTRALRHIHEKARPEYLGPAISVCYWQGARWAEAHNPTPGEYPVPAEPAWLSVPAPANQAMETLHSNIYRHLWAEHSDNLMRLSQTQDPGTWLTEQLAQARQWGWSIPDQVHFLVMQNLKKTEPAVIKNWLPEPGETPQAHFERLFNEAKFWSGEESA